MQFLFSTQSFLFGLIAEEKVNIPDVFTSQCRMFESLSGKVIKQLVIDASCFSTNRNQ